jgi:hypothetical protein
MINLDVQSCFCRGPQNGQPLCPCQMRGVTVRNGRYVRETDLGPAPPARDVAGAFVGGGSRNVGTERSGIGGGSAI